MPRQTADVIALVLVVVVAVVVVATALTTLWVVVMHPEQDITRAADAVGRIIAVVVAALVGYMAGRQVSGPS